MTVLAVPPQARWPRGRAPAQGLASDLARLPPDLWRALAGDAATRERYHAKVYRRGPGKCAYWLGSLSSSGHGRMRAGTRGSDADRPGSLVVVAHVYGYILSRGLAYLEPGAGHLGVIRHRCDEPSCQNPAHWVSGSHGDNARDYAARSGIAGSPLTDRRGARGRARAIRQAILDTLGAGGQAADVESAIRLASAAGIPGAQQALF